MTCRELDEFLTYAAALNKEAQEHLAACASCRSLRAAVEGPTSCGGALSHSVLDRIRGPVLSSLLPVRPLAPVPVFAAIFICIFAAAASLGALQFGIYGWPALTMTQRATIFVVLVMLAVLVAATVARHMRPGTTRISGGLLFALTFGTMEAVFLILFHNYSRGRFIHSGTACLCAGLLCAIPAGLLIWLIVRRGYLLNPVSAGAAIGCIAGLAGLAALEIHCPILTIPHIVVWHAAVVAVCAAAGAVGGLVAGLRTGP